MSDPISGEDLPADTIDDERVPDAVEDPDDESLDTVTNDAVAGETVYPEEGDGSDNGPTGGAPREGAPDEWEHDDETERVDFGDDLDNKPL